MMFRASPAVFPALGLAMLLTVPRGTAAELDVLRIGSSGTLTGEAADEARQKSAMDTLKSFIKDETGLNNELLRQKDWQALAEQLVGKKVQLGVFQGYEFAWVQEKYSRLKPLAVAVNGHTYPV